MKAKEFLNQLRHDDIVEAIRTAEKKTSGEIRVFISRHEPVDPVAAAQAEFARMGMNHTRDKNGVLIYMAPRARKFAIVGDAGVHERCGDAFWQSVAGEMVGHFKRTDFTEGLLHGINKAGELLAQHFPGGRDGGNQLPDNIAHD